MWGADPFAEGSFGDEFEPDTAPAPEPDVVLPPFRFRAGEIYIVPRRTLHKDVEGRVVIYNVPLRTVTV
jgi:hypothetical protein